MWPQMHTGKGNCKCIWPQMHADPTTALDSPNRRPAKSFLLQTLGDATGRGAGSVAPVASRGCAERPFNGPAVGSSLSP
jgi:hypothetical protein